MASKFQRLPLSQTCQRNKRGSVIRRYHSNTVSKHSGKPGYSYTYTEKHIQPPTYTERSTRYTHERAAKKWCKLYLRLRNISFFSSCCRPNSRPPPSLPSPPFSFLLAQCSHYGGQKSRYLNSLAEGRRGKSLLGWTLRVMVENSCRLTGAGWPHPITLGRCFPWKGAPAAFHFWREPSKLCRSSNVSVCSSSGSSLEQGVETVRGRLAMASSWVNSSPKFNLPVASSTARG